MIGLHRERRRAGSTCGNPAADHPTYALFATQLSGFIFLSGFHGARLRSMRRHRALAVVSAVQLCAGLSGHLIARREGRTFDIAVIGWRGDPAHVARDSWFLGTGLSAPVTMLVTQTVATARLVAGPSAGAERTLGLLGALMTSGYLVEREVRDVLAPGGWHPVRTPVVAAGLGLAASMAALSRHRTAG